MTAEQYDYIIVGAGSSGCVLADGLSADGRSRVLLIEAGGRNETELVNMPRAFMKMVHARNARRLRWLARRRMVLDGNLALLRRDGILSSAGRP